MKKLLTLLLLTASAIAQNNTGGTLVSAPVRPKSVNDTFPTAYANEVRGGPFSIASTSAMSNIPSSRLVPGSLAYVTADGLFRIYNTLSNWTTNVFSITNITGLQSALDGKLGSSDTSLDISAKSYQFQSATNNEPSLFSQMGVGSTAGGIFGGFYSRNDGLYKLAFASGDSTNSLTDRVRFRSGSLELLVPLSFVGTNSAFNVATTRSNLGLSSVDIPTFSGVVVGGGNLTNPGVRFQTSDGSHDGFYRGTALGQGKWIGSLVNGVEVSRVFSNRLGFYKPFEFDETIDAATSRTNLGIPWSGLTNTNAENMRSALGLPWSGLTNTNADNIRNTMQAAAATNYAADVGPGAANRALTLINNDSGATVLEYDALGGDLWVVANPEYFRGAIGIPWSGLTNTNAVNMRSALGLGASALTNTNTVNFRTAIGLEFNYESGDAQEETAFLNSLGLSSYDAGSYSEGNISLMVVGGAISLWPKGQTNAFSGEDSVFEVMSYTLTNTTNGTWSVYERDKFRKEIELSLPALTNTNNANFQSAVFTTNTAPTNTANVNAVDFHSAVSWMQVTVKTNGTNATFRVPLFQ